MDRIIQLPENIKNMIAAGEVVEGPFSVVKELVENSLDAASTEIDVQVVDAGLKKIMVRDNGSGIHASDIKLSIMEHATSKLISASGLEKIFTYGFRGEALSSIASISDFVIISKRRDEPEGARLESLSGEVSVSGFHGAPGTTVIVENLFHNVPARKKFLKAQKTELRNIRETLLKLAIPSYNTSFSFEVDGKREMTMHAVDSHEERIRQIFGRSAAEGLSFEELSDLKVRISGFLSKPEYIRGSRNMQFLYINGRPVEHRYFHYHLSRAYEAVIPKGKYPAAIIFIDIDPELTDVNVHPAKREVRLFDQKYIDELIFGLAVKALNRIHAVPRQFFSAQEAPCDSSAVSQVQPAGRGFHSAPENDFSAGLFAAGVTVSESSDLSIVPAEKGAAIKVLGVLFGTYIVAEKDDSMHLVDFHAAHERILYDRLISEAGEMESQELLFPVTMELSMADRAAVNESLDLFSSAGFEIEEFPGNAIVVRSVPVAAGREDIEVLIKNMIANIREDRNNNNIREKFMASIACHSARRRNDELSRGEMLHLVEEVFEMKDLRCPHGRPFIYSLSKNDLERMFKR